jgi:hypothetical protein
MLHGRCVVCGIRGRGRRDFICEDCGDPESITIHCAGCRTTIRQASRNAIDVVKRFLGIDMGGLKKGMTIRVTNCLECAGPGATTSTQVFRVRRPSPSRTMLN